MNYFEVLELYHGGTDRIEMPMVKFGRPDLDFGPGFYLTDIYSQADSWARKRSEKRGGVPMINKYLFNRNEFFSNDNYRSLVFPAYNEEWLDFVVENRLGRQTWKGYDLIEGGVADDRVVDTIDLYFSDFIDKDEAIRRLRYLRPNNQICILNQKVIDEYLSFTDCEELD